MKAEGLHEKQYCAQDHGQTGADIVEFMVGPQIGERRHLWVLAAKGTPPPAGRLAALLDERLMTFNADYAAFRRQGRIHPPTVETVAEDVIYRWSREVRGKMGGQSKIPHIDPTLEGELVKSLAEYAGKSSACRRASALESHRGIRTEGVPGADCM